VKNEFISVEDISSMDEGGLRYDMFAKAYNYQKEINMYLTIVLIPAEIRLIEQRKISVSC
jgi:hypothetical protein